MVVKRLNFPSIAALSIVLVFDICICESFTDEERSQLNGLKNLTGLEVDVVLTCNLALFTTFTDYMTAEEKCEQFEMGTGRGGQLAKIKDEKRNSQVAKLLESAYPINKQPQDRWAPSKWAWVGLRVKSKMGRLMSGVYYPVQWEYADGTQAGEYQSWMPRQPDHLRSGHSDIEKLCGGNTPCHETFVRVNHGGLWDDSFVNMALPYVCQYQGKYMVSGERKSWDEANISCKNAGLEFAKIRSDDELMELVGAIEYFLGPRSEERRWDDDNWVWIGGHDTHEEGGWEWSDGQHIEWGIHWALGGGNDNRDRHHEDGQDVLAVSRWGTVDDSYAVKMRHFACQCPGT